MAETLKVDLCVIGAGSGGLTVAAGASRLGASTVLIERDKMGGDCLNYGCVPSKSLLAAAAAAQAVRDGGALGVNGPNPEVDFAAVHRHVHEVMAAIAPQDSEERFEGLGVKVIRDAARFTGPTEVTAGLYRVVARRFVVASGSRPAVPDLKGLDEVPYYTNETIFDNRARPEHLTIVGGGPIGCEVAQAHQRLGARVTVVQRRRLLPRDDPELAEILKTCLRAEGVDVLEGARVVEVARHENRVAVTVEREGACRRIEGSHLLLAVGRRPAVEGLDLEVAGVRYGPKGIEVDARLRTSNRRVF
ncbi:MAG: FAD-dependent oxidoreductase, partial [Alphaproteobacteria bacterium]